MAKKEKKIEAKGQEVDLSKIKSVRFTLDLKIPKEDFDELLKKMSGIVVDEKKGEHRE